MSVKIQFTLSGQGGELESHTFNVEEPEGGHEIREELCAWIGDMILDAGDTITITEIES